MFRSHPISELEKQEGLELIRAIKKQIHIDPKNQEKYQSILISAEAAFDNDELDMDEISRLDILLANIIFPVIKQDEDEDEWEEKITPSTITTENIVSESHVCKEIDTDQENTTIISGGDIENQDQSCETKREESLYPTLDVSAKEYDLSKLNKDVSHLFVIPNTPAPTQMKAVENSSEKIFADKKEEFSGILEQLIETLKQAVTENQNENNIIRLQKIERLKVSFDQYKAKVSDEQMQVYKELLMKAILHKVNKKKNLNEQNTTSLASNKSSFVNNLPKKEIKPRPSKQSEKRKALAN